MHASGGMLQQCLLGTVMSIPCCCPNTQRGHWGKLGHSVRLQNSRNEDGWDRGPVEPICPGLLRRHPYLRALPHAIKWLRTIRPTPAIVQKPCVSDHFGTMPLVPSSALLVDGRLTCISTLDIARDAMRGHAKHEPQVTRVALRAFITKRCVHPTVYGIIPFCAAMRA